jgi:phospholipid/cholesterol/gamma-HCH transport system substrate-binding protein
LPTRPGAGLAARALTVALLVLATLVIAFLLFFSGGDSYEVSLALDNASQLVKGNQVKVGAVPVGSVSKLTLGADGRALIVVSIDDASVQPLHRGTRAEIRSTSLAGVANRYVALIPGPANAPEIPGGGTIPAKDTSAEVDLDAVLNALDPTTLRDLKLLLKNGGSALSGRGRALGRAIEALDPALAQVDQLEREVLHDQGTFGRFLVESADVVSSVAPRRAALERLVSSGHATLDELAQHDSELDSLLRRLPPTLRTTNTTLVNLRAALTDLDPTIKLAQPVARPLAETLDRLRPVTRDARPVIAKLRDTVDRPGSADLIGVLQRLPRLRNIALPALDSATATVNDLLPIVKDARPYAPDVIGGLMNGFGGSTSGYYDANGHYTRISFQSNAYSLESVLSLLPIPSSPAPGLLNYQRGISARCPGSSTQPAPDRSNPFVVPGCDPKQGTP